MTSDRDGISWITDVIHVAAGCGTARGGMDGYGGYDHCGSDWYRRASVAKHVGLPELRRRIESDSQSLRSNGGRSAVAGLRVVLRVTVRRLRCPKGGCSRRIFCERLSKLAAWAQTTDRLSEAHRLIGNASGGEAGSRLTNHLTVLISTDTLLRRIK